MPTERQLGDRWCETKEAAGAWVVKLPASTLAGLPDWLLLHGIVQLWEAKKALSGFCAYNPGKQLSGAQHFFVRMLARYAPECGGVLVLDEDGFVEVPAKRALRPMSAVVFSRRKEMYRE